MLNGAYTEQGLVATNHGFLSVNGRRRTIDGGAWTVAIDLCKVDALLTMLKQLDDQESAAQLMNAGNQVFTLWSIFVVSLAFICFFFLLSKTIFRNIFVILLVVECVPDSSIFEDSRGGQIRNVRQHQRPRGERASFHGLMFQRSINSKSFPMIRMISVCLDSPNVLVDRRKSGSGAYKLRWKSGFRACNSRSSIGYSGGH